MDELKRLEFDLSGNPTGTYEHLNVPDEVGEVAPELRVDVVHVLLEVLSADLHLPLQTGLVARPPGPHGRGLHQEALVGWRQAEVSRVEGGVEEGVEW